MSEVVAKRLLNKLESSQEWPRRADVKVLEDLFKWQWFREAMSDKLMNAHPGGWENDAYVVDPLGSRIAEAFADLQFGVEPDFTAKKQQNQKWLDDLVENMGLPAECNYGAEIQVSEGEVWWRGRIEKDMSDWPIVEFHSRTVVVPMFRGPFVIAAAFISTIEDGNNAWRYVEVHAENVILNRLYKIKMNASVLPMYRESFLPLTYYAGKPFGEEVPLTDRPETENLPPVWNHGCGLLCGRILNKRGRTNWVGVSQYQRAEDLLFSLNEAATIGQGNMKLTARQRAVIDESVLEPVTDDYGNTVLPKPYFNSQEHLLVRKALDDNLEGDHTQFQVLEYSFDSDKLILWYDHLENLILTRTRTAPSLVGKNIGAESTSPAIRARLLDSVLASNTKGAFWDRELPRMLQCFQRLDALPTSQGGFGRGWDTPTDLSEVKRKSIIPEEPKDETDRHATAVGAGLESLFTAIKSQHPDWDNAKVEEEIDRIIDEKKRLAEVAPKASFGEENGNINRPGKTDPATGREERVPGAGERG